MKVCIVLGTRPEIIKLTPIIRYCQNHSVEFFIIHSNQHYSENMDKIFFEELNLPQPRYNLSVGSGTHANQIGNILLKIENVLISEKPNIVLVQGDTNTVVATALATSKLSIPLGHIEAGLRSYDKSMPEETNRIITDHVSDFLFAPTKIQEQILISEGIDKKKVFVTGNTIVDSVLYYKEIAMKKSKILSQFNIKPKGYFLITVHRSKNVDISENLIKLKDMLNTIALLYNEYSLVWPIHPRTRKKIQEHSIKIPDNIIIIEPVGFLDFLLLEMNAKIIITDSGGVQEEACILNIPCITLRENTERPETVNVGMNILCGLDKKKVMLAIKKFIEYSPKCSNPFGDGHTAEYIMKSIIKWDNKPKEG